jgi:mRNA-degrading endonuclease RelE of RelBE toxin-antitoxin system
VIAIYIEHFDKISEQFYDDGAEEVEEEIEQVPVAIEKPAIQSKSEVYKDAIGGYELLLDIETDENKIKLYKDIIEGYELLLGN